MVGILYAFFFYRWFVQPYSLRWKGLYGDMTYPPGDVRGIDISHHQGEIDWNLLRNADIQGAPVSFIFVKATEGASMIDENFNHNFYHTRLNGMTRGAYHYFSNKSSGASQAKFFCKVVQLEPGDLPPVLDVEEFPPTTMDKRNWKKEILDWLQAVEQHYHVKPIIYTGYRYKLDYLNDKVFDQYPLWIAHYYVDQLQYKGKWMFWQHTDAGHVPGIKGEVDINLFQGDRTNLDSLCIKDFLYE